MNRRSLSIVSRAFIIVSILITVGQAFACIGDGSSFAIGFRETAKPDEVIVIVTKKDREGKMIESKEILDDTGFIGLHLAVTQVIKQAADPSGKTIATADPLVVLMKSRFNVLKRLIQSSGVKPDQTPGLSAMEQAINASPVKISELEEGIMALNSTLYAAKIEILAKVRKNSTESFGEEEVGFSTLGLPTYVRTRSLSCNAGIESFKPVAAKAADGGRPARGSNPAAISK